LSIWDKPVLSDGKIGDMEGFTFKVVSAALRHGIITQYGEKTAVDIVVEIDGENYTFSGFNAGIVVQVMNASPDDFPFFATVESLPVKNGTTLQLVPVAEGDGDPLVAPEREPQSELVPAGDDDIPF
jgi:hypothetical protein